MLWGTATLPPRASVALLLSAALLLAASPPAFAAEGAPSILATIAEVEIRNGTAFTEVRRTLDNPRADDVWLEVPTYYPASAILSRLAVGRAGAIVEEAAAGPARPSNGTPSEAAWLAAAENASAAPVVAASAFVVAVRVPAHASVDLVVGWDETLRTVRGAYRYALPLAGLGPSLSFTFAASISMASPLGELQVSAPFPTSSSGAGTAQASVSASAPLPSPRGSLHLNFTPQASGGYGFVSSCLEADGGFFTYTFYPSALDLALEPIPKSVSFALDFSGSMAGNKEAQAKSAFSGILQQLSPFDRFEVLRFDSRVVALTSGLEDATAENIALAIDRIAGQTANGSTNLGAALDRALTDLSGETHTLPMLVLMTDGNPTVGLKTADELTALAREKNRAEAAIHTLALGYEASVDILSSLSAATGGTTRLIDPDADVVQQISDFYSEVSEPLIEDLVMTFSEPAYNITVPPLTILYGGSDVTAQGKIAPPGGTVTVSIVGRSSKGEFSATDSFRPAEGACAGADRAFALSALAALLARAASEGPTSDLVDEIVALASENGYSTPWTPFQLPSGASISTEPIPGAGLPPGSPAPADTTRSESALLNLPPLVPLLAAAAVAAALAALWWRARKPRDGQEP